MNRKTLKKFKSHTLCRFKKNPLPPLSLLKSGILSTGLSTEFFFLSMLSLEPDIPLPLAAGSASFLAADFFDSLLPLGPSSLCNFLDTITNFPASEKAVHLPGALGLALDFDSTWLVMKVDAGTGLVDFLSPVTSAPDKSFDDVILEDPKAGHPQLQGLTFFLTDHELADDGVASRQEAM